MPREIKKIKNDKLKPFLENRRIWFGMENTPVAGHGGWSTAVTLALRMLRQEENPKSKSACAVWEDPVSTRDGGS